MTQVLQKDIGYDFLVNGRTWRTAAWPCRILRKDGGETLFSDAKCVRSAYQTGVGKGFKEIYSDFPGIPGLVLECRIWAEDSTGDVLFELVPLQDAGVQEIFWPEAFENKAPEAMTVLPMMQGCLIPNYTDMELPYDWPTDTTMPEHGRYSCSRAMYMQFFGQYDADGGVMTIFETRYDGGMEPVCGGGKEVLVGARWRESLGKVGYARKLRVKFFPAGCDYNDLAKAYRAYIRSIGELVTLKQKAAANPKVAELIGRPIVHTYIWYHKAPSSEAYDHAHPERNDQEQTFDAVAAQLRELKSKGLKKAVLHLDGWGRRGYDNQHPDYLPPAEHLGGWKGMQDLQDTCHELGYFFGIHDQFRDYFYDADTFDEENAVHREDGSVFNHAIWAGGKQALLCATMAPDYIRRNYAALREHGILPDNAYLDVFSCVELDECFHPSHPMTREQCAKYRALGFLEVASHGTLLQSEEGIDWAFPSLTFLHHAPHALDKDWYKGRCVGIPIPLLDLVYHDCMIIPWIPGKGGFGVDERDENSLIGLLSGGGTYISTGADEATVAYTDILTGWQEDVQMREMLRHEIIDGNPRHQKTWFEGGYAAEIDLDAGTYVLTRPE